MFRYFWATFRSQLSQSRLLTLLTLFGVALGVASVWSIRLINVNAVGSFKASLHAVSGDADLSIVGTLPQMDEKLFPMVWSTPGVSNAWPIIHSYVTLAGHEHYFLEVLGVDFFSGQDVPWAGEKKQDVAAVLSQPGWTAISPTWAREQHLSEGDRFEVGFGARRISLTVGALVDFSKIAPQASSRLMVLDIAQAQSLFGSPSKLSEIDVKIRPGVPFTQVAERLQTRLGPTVQVLTPEQQERRAQGMLEAFSLNLTSLSLISLFVGLFLVYSSTQAALLRRRGEFGILRSLGATRGQVFALILAQTTLVGIEGTLLGIPVGYLAARLNLHAVSETVANLYVLAEIQQLHVTPSLALWGIVIGLAGAWGGGILPAWEMARQPSLQLLSAQTLYERVRRWTLPFAWSALVIWLSAGAIYWKFHGRWNPVGFVLAIALLAGQACLAPFALTTLFGRVPLRRFSWAYGLRHLEVRLQTTAFATAALAACVSMLVGVTLMIQSFRHTVILWAERNLQADIYISTESWMRARSESTLDAALVSDLKQLPSVRAVDEQRYFFAYKDGHRLGVTGLRMGLADPGRRFILLSGDPVRAYAQMHQGGVIIGEPLARRLHTGVGGTLELMGPTGLLRLPIAGVSYDYSTDWGTAVLDMDVMNRLFGAGPLNNIALYLRNGVDSQTVIDQLHARYPEKPLLIRSNRRLLQEIVRVFDQTFAVTRILEAMCLLTAVCGISLALLILARESRAELALYRALGATRVQVSRVFLAKGLGMTVAALALGLAGGVALAAILIFVINRDYFGWTIPLNISWPSVAKECAIILAASVAASLYPALRAGATPATELSREEL